MNNDNIRLIKMIMRKNNSDNSNNDNVYKYSNNNIC